MEIFPLVPLLAHTFPTTRVYFLTLSVVLYYAEDKNHGGHHILAVASKPVSLFTEALGLDTRGTGADWASPGGELEPEFSALQGERWWITSTTI